MLALARAVWRRLPVWFRRPLARRLTRYGPPLPVAAPAARGSDAPVIVVGFLTSPSGLGQASRLALRQLERSGQKVFGVDLSQNFMEKAGAVAFAFRDGRTVHGPGRVLVNINAPHMAYVFRILGADFLRQKHITGYWAWELPAAPESWREGFARVHDLAAPSAFVADAIRALGGAPSIRVAPHPVCAEDLPQLTRRVSLISRDNPFRIVSALNAASGFERKNPLALIAAFKTAFGDRDDVRLCILASNAEDYPPARDQLQAARGGDKRIELTLSTLDRANYWRWYGSPDLYASLHRAEGFGLPLAESMAMGVPVLATAWSANVEYMNEQNALPVAFKLVPITDPQRKYEGAAWAQADVGHAAALLQRAVDDPVWLSQVAHLGRADARERFSQFSPWNDSVRTDG